MSNSIFTGQENRNDLLYKILESLGGGLSSSEKTSFGELAVAHQFVQAGWSFPYNINASSIRTITSDGGTVAHSGSFAELNTGTDPAGFASIRTDDLLTYTPGVGAILRITAVFDTPVADSYQLIGILDNEDGWAFGYIGTTFGVLRRKDSVNTFIPQSSWNKDTRDTLNPQKGNVYEIKFQWLGFGMQYFSIENSQGDLALVHTIEYANLNEDVSVSNPSLPVIAACGNTGNTTSLTLKTPSAVAMTQGQPYPEPFTTVTGYAYEETIVSGSNYLFTIYNPETYLAKANRLYGEVLLATIATDGTKAVTFRVILNSVLTAPVYTDIATGITPLQYDESATAYTNGLEILAVTLGKADSIQLDINKILEGAKLNPDNQITLIAESTASSDVSVSFTLRSRI